MQRVLSRSARSWKSGGPPSHNSQRSVRQSSTLGGLLQHHHHHRQDNYNSQQQRQTRKKSLPITAFPSTTTFKPSSLSFHSSAVLSAEELPYHVVVGLPALSPTMDSGSLAEWYVKEGDSFSAGDVIAKIETDKATMDFEAQDDGNVAKLLISAGKGSDLPIGTPIMITVEDAEDVAAFANYEHQQPAAAAAAEETPPPAPETKAEAPSPPPAPAAAAASSPPPPPPPAAATPTPPPPPAPAATTPTSSSPAFAVAWGTGAATKSPLAKTLAKEHQAYIEKYGTTGQRPLL